MRHRGSSGFQRLADKSLYKDPVYPGAQLTAFVQAGYGDYRGERFCAYLGAGVSAAGLFESRAPTSWV